MKTLHVVPTDDWTPHTLTRHCQCKPTTEQIAGTIMVSHESYDGREHLPDEHLTPGWDIVEAAPDVWK